MFAVALPFLFVVHLSAAYNYETRFLQIPVDHFSFAINDTFKLRYLINDTFWDKDNKGPIFFYTGNEGDIALFANNSGFIWEIAPKFKALIVFGEHRYYGESLPYGSDSFKKQKLGYLTSQQALADYADLLTTKFDPKTNPVIAFGGSYGGMLAAYMRMKYPHIIRGAIAASAPIWQFEGITPCDAYSRVLTGSFKIESNQCVDIVNRSWSALNNLIKTNEGQAWLQKNWTLCGKTTPDAVQPLKDWLLNMYSNLAMANYPYPASFLGDLPGYPVKEFCKAVDSVTTKDDKELLSALRRGVDIAYNYTGKAGNCYNVSDQNDNGLGMQAWSYQSCTEMVMPMCSTGINDMFEPTLWDLQQFEKDCFKMFNVLPQPFLAEKIYGGKNIRAWSNIIFSNGLLDPWSSGGVLRTITKHLISVVIPEGAHHLDLRASNPLDPQSVQKARELYQNYISSWISLHK